MSIDMNNSEFEIIASLFDKEIEWLDKIVKRREDIFHNRSYNPTTTNEKGEKFCDYKTKLSYEAIQTISPPDISNIQSNYSNFINENKLSFEERLLLVLSLITHLQPEFLLKRYKDEIEKYPQIGLVRGHNFNGYLPTGISFLFIAGDNIKQRLRFSSLFLPDSTLIKENILHIEQTQSGDPIYSGKLILSQTYFELFTSTLQTVIKTSFHEN